jgi:hypothetical protein
MRPALEPDRQALGDARLADAGLAGEQDDPTLAAGPSTLRSRNRARRRFCLACESRWEPHSRADSLSRGCGWGAVQPFGEANSTLFTALRRKMTPL